MMRSKLRGKNFGRLKVLKFAGISKHRSALWLCRCKCGETRILSTNVLHTQNTRSCGCLSRDMSSKRIGKLAPFYKHGHSRVGQRSATYISWALMLQRCLNFKATDAQYYFGRGVKVATRWLKFKNFLHDMGAKPRGTTLGRFGDVGNYEPGNVAWQTRLEQGRERHRKFQARKAA